MIELHPLCTLFPRVTGAEFDALVADIKANGLSQPITLHDGMILDGGNRYRACLEAGIEPHFTTFDGGNIVAFVLSANLHRRHLSAGQQAAIVASAQDWAKAQVAGSNQHKARAESGSAILHDLSSAAGRAAESGASLRTQKMADKVAKADPELAKQVGHGLVSLPAAVEQLTGKRPGAKPKEQKPQEQDKPDDIVSRLRARIAELEQENADIREQYEEAMSNMDVMADELTAYRRAADPEHAKKYLQQQEYLAVVERQRDDWMNQCAQLKREVKALRRRMGEAA
jgi:ParB-like chromosome segregation protein Spo0J